MTTAIPQQVVTARRTAGVILVLSTFGTVIMLLVLVAWWSTQPPAVAVTTGTSSNTSSASAPSQPAIAPPVSAQVALQQQVDVDRQQVEALVGHWVPQLSSKTVGTKADDIIYGYHEILDHFNMLKARYPRALLLRSDDYTSFEKSDYWVVVMPMTYASGTVANLWCDTEGFDHDNCFAKLLLHTGAASGTTVLRK